MKEQFSICNKLITVTHPYALKRGGYWEPFKVCSSGLSDVSVECRECARLPEQRGRVLGKTAEYSVSVHGGAVYKKTYLGTAEGALCVYPSEACSARVSLLPESAGVALGDGFLWSTLSLTQLLFKKDVLLLHASYISFQNKAILFSAPSGTGKSTQASLWESVLGATVINGDKAALSFEGGKVLAHSVPFCGTSGICKNESFPLGALVMLKRGERNSVKRLGGAAAVAQIIANVYLDFFAPGEQERCVDLLIELLGAVPVFELSCTPDEGAVRCLLESLEQSGVF